MDVERWRRVHGERESGKQSHTDKHGAPRTNCPLILTNRPAQTPGPRPLAPARPAYTSCLGPPSHTKILL